MSLVSRLALFGGVLEHDIGEFEKPDGEGVGSIFSNGLEKARKKRRSYNLEFERFWVGDFDGEIAWIGAIHEGKVFFV